ncbi:MAG: phosphoribosyl-AMP cyclohydrolase [Pseudomonadota bacterium]
MPLWLPPSDDKSIQELGTTLRPKFDGAGLIPAVAQDAADGTVLMMAFMNAEALERTLTTGIVHYYSRSRRTLWKKGETSGQLQHVVQLLVDCDQDTILVKVRVGGDGGACHTGERSCFFRTADSEGALRAAGSDRSQRAPAGAPKLTGGS